MSIARTSRRTAQGQWHSKSTKSDGAAPKTSRENRSSYKGRTLDKRIDKTIDGVIKDYGDALRRLEDF